MTDISDNLITQTHSTQASSSQENIPKQELSNEQVSNESEASQTSTNPFVSSEDASKGEEESTDTDYSLNCPEYVSQEEVKAHIEAFKEAGIDAKTAQKVVDRLVEHGRTKDERFGASLEEDRSILQKEFGSDYDVRERDISRYFYQENIPDEDVQSLVSTWGFQKTFKFFDRYAQMNKESSVGDTFARSEGGASSIASDDFFNTPEFIDKRRAGDAEANKKIRDWAMQQATLNQ